MVQCVYVLKFYSMNIYNYCYKLILQININSLNSHTIKVSSALFPNSHPPVFPVHCQVLAHFLVGLDNSFLFSMLAFGHEFGGGVRYHILDFKSSWLPRNCPLAIFAGVACVCQYKYCWHILPGGHLQQAMSRGQCQAI